jgi:hypothetical protein
MTYTDYRAPEDRDIRLSDAAVAVACQTCEAWPGIPCKSMASPDGSGARRPHPARLRLVDEYIRAGVGVRA